MRKRIKFGILAVTLTFGIVAYSVFAQSRIWLSTSSPNKTYTVELTGSKSRPISPFTMHQTRFNLFKKGQPDMKGVYLDSYDWFDSGFADSYPEFTWVNESILRFGLDTSESEKSLDSLAVSNNSSRTIKYLKIEARDMFLIFDMQPNSTIKLSVPRQGWQSWVTSEGEFANGQRVSWNGVNFFHRDKLTEPLRYCISVNDNASIIESPNTEGYNGSGTGDNPNIPKAVNCNP